MRYPRRTCSLAALVVVLALTLPGLALSSASPAAGDSPVPDPRAIATAPEEPIIGPTSWADSFDDALGLSWLEGSQLVGGQLNLNRMELLGEDVAGIWALTEGPDDRFYMGTDDARLWSYDPVTGETLDLGLPVPGECTG